MLAAFAILAFMAAFFQYASGAHASEPAKEMPGVFGSPPVAAPDAESQDSNIKIGGVYSLTGLAAPANTFSQKGARLAVQEINAANGGVMGRKLELQMFDNMSTPIGSKLAVKHASEAGVAALVGPSWSSHALPAGREAEALDLPMVSDTATMPAVTLVGDCVFRVCFTDVFQAKVLAWFAAKKLGLKKIVTLVNLNSEYSIGLDALFQSRFKAYGGQIVQRLPYKSVDLLGAEDFGALVSQVAYLDVDGVFIPGHAESGKIVAALRKEGVMVPALGGDGWEATTAVDLEGNEGQGVYFCTHWSPLWDNEKTQAFVARYKNTVELSSGLALAYDAVYLLADAMNRAGSTDAAALCEALSQTKDFSGVTGSITFDEHGDPHKSAVIMSYEQETPVYLQTVSPEDMQANP